jgi:exopolysaccharide production protein ExoZ
MELLSIQYLRAGAAIAVVIFHIETQLSRMGFAGDWPKWLAAGVDIFFVVSGFIMVLTTRSRSLSPGEFYWRRFVRIVPLYWTVTTLVVTVQLLKPEWLQSARFDSVHAISSYFFVPSRHPVLGTMEPVLVPGWTLNYEVFFYIIFGFTLLLPPRIRLTVLSMILLAFVGLGVVIPTELSVLSFYTSNLLLEFVFGAIIANIYLRGLRISGALAWAAFVAGLAMLVLSDLVETPRAFGFGLPAALIVFGAVELEAGGRVRSHQVPRFLGDASYSIYLVHGIALSALGQIWRKLGLIASGYVAFTALAILV